MHPPVDLSVYLITDPRLCGTRGIVETVRAAVAGGATIVQLRDPHAPARRMVEEARVLTALLRPLGIPLIVNDRVDVAIAADADGVHVGQSDLAAADARRMLGPDRILGLSIANPAELAVSPLEGVDYIGVGPVFATGTKPDAGAAIGLEGVSRMRARVALGIVGIGGIDASNAADVVRAGAQGVAVVSAICAATDALAATRRIAAAVRCAHDTPDGGR